MIVQLTNDVEEVAFDILKTGLVIFDNVFVVQLVGNEFGGTSGVIFDI